MLIGEAGVETMVMAGRSTISLLQLALGPVIEWLWGDRTQIVHLREGEWESWDVHMRIWIWIWRWSWNRDQFFVIVT